MLFSAGQEQKKTLTGCCNTCSMRLDTHITNLLPRNVKRRGEWLKLGEMGKKNLNAFYIFH